MLCMHLVIGLSSRLTHVLIYINVSFQKYGNSKTFRHPLMEPTRHGSPHAEYSQQVLHLENTTADLYMTGSFNEPPLYVPLFPSSRVQLAPGIPRNQKYLFYESSYAEPELSAEPTDDLEYEKLRQTLSCRSLTDFVQNMIFAAGNMEIVLVDPDLPGCVPDGVSSSREHVKMQIEETISVLDPSQRPRIRWVDELDIMTLKPGQRIAPLMPLDNLVDFACVVSPDLHYELLSNQGLANSGLKTPRCEIVDFNTLAPATANCCAACRNHGHSELIEDACTGVRRAWRNEQIRRTVSVLRAKALPYTVKLQQAMGGSGTMWVKSENELAEVTWYIGEVYLKKYLSRLDATNLHLKPVNLILSDIIDGDTRAVSWFIQKNGEFVFISCSTQAWSDEGHFTGSRIVYSEQATLAKCMGPTLRRVSDFLHGKGYYGPVGIDVVEDGQGEQYIVDLNVRTISSSLLGSLRGHFVSRGLVHAGLLLLKFGMRRREFRERMNAEIIAGCVVIVGWFEQNTRLSTARIVVGAEDGGSLADLIDTMEELSVK